MLENSLRRRPGTDKYNIVLNTSLGLSTILTNSLMTTDNQQRLARELTDTQSVSPSVGHQPAQQEHFTVQISKAEKQLHTRLLFTRMESNTFCSHNVLALCQRSRIHGNI